MVVREFVQFVRKPRNVVIFSGIVTTGVFGIKAISHILPAQVYRPLMEAYKNGRNMTLEESQRNEFQDVCQDIGANMGSYNVFVTSRWDIRSRGLPWLPNGVQFGVPAILKAEPDLSARRFSDPIKTTANTDDGKLFRDSMRLSENARRFGIAREVVKIERNATAASVILAPAVTATGFAGMFAAQVFIPLPVLANVAVVGFCSVLIYQFLMGVVNEREDFIADDKAASIGDDYIRGGVEYYEKMIQRNLALRSILGQRGKEMYTYYGNETPGWVYSSGACNTQKRDKLKIKLEQTEKKETTT